MIKKYLLDTHMWLWYATGSSSLSIKLKKHIEDSVKKNTLHVSAISIWEIAMLEHHGKIKLGQPTISWVNHALLEADIQLVPLSPEIAVESCELPNNFHGDPADRIIVASARISNLILITKDQKILNYGKEGHVHVF